MGATEERAMNATTGTETSVIVLLLCSPRRVKLEKKTLRNHPPKFQLRFLLFGHRVVYSFELRGVN